MEKIDFKKKLKNLYHPPTSKVVQVDVPKMNFLMVDGQGDPNHSQEYAEAVEVLFQVSYTLKFMIKKGELAIDYGVMPLEGLWWADDMSAFSVNDKSSWKWTMMIMQPEFATKALVEKAIQDVAKKKKPAAISKVRFESFSEGKAAQIMHIGPFSEEGPNVAKVHAYIAENGALSGKHHEIYLSDIRKADPTKWKTVIRQPFIG